MGLINRTTTGKYLALLAVSGILIYVAVSFLSDTTSSKDESISVVIEEKDDKQAHPEVQKRAKSPLAKSDDVQTGTPDSESIDEELVALSNDPELAFIETVEDILDHIDHPSVQRYIAKLPEQAQESIRLEALRHSVSKRVDAIEASDFSAIDVDVLFNDIDELSRTRVMLPGEGDALKVYLQNKM